MQIRNLFRHRTRTIASIVFVALLGASSPAFAAATEISFLRAQGQDIVDEQGEKVLLRGVGLGNWLLPEGYMWKFGGRADRPRRIEKLVSDLIGPANAARFWEDFRKNYITEADIRRISELGYNSVRPALNARLFLTETDPPQPVLEGFQLLDNLVRWCRANRVYVIIDMHAAPGGQTGQNIDDSRNDQPELFTNLEYQDRLVNLWTDIARRYQDEPAVAGYDLLNEPLPERTGAAAKYKHLLEPLYQRIARAIRAVDSRHAIILEGADWANDWSVFTAPFDSNLVYQFHYYCWDTPVRLKGIGEYLRQRERLNAPIWVGETGERDSGIYWATTEYFEAHNIGWSFWPWKKMDSVNAPCSIKPPAAWSAIVAYANGGAKPPPDVAQKAFDELLVNLRLENCRFYPAVVNAMLRRLPVRLEAENYGQGGPGVSYQVKDGSRRSPYYRFEEPVRIGVTDREHRRSDPYLTLGAKEWTAYNVDSSATQDLAITVRVRAASGPAEAELSVGARELNLKIDRDAWTEIKLGSASLSPGPNRLQFSVKSGVIDLDWFDLDSGKAGDASASAPEKVSTKTERTAASVHAAGDAENPNGEGRE